MVWRRRGELFIFMVFWVGLGGEMAHAFAQKAHCMADLGRPYWANNVGYRCQLSRPHIGYVNG